MKTLIAASALALGLVIVGTPETAEAQGFGIYFGSSPSYYRGGGYYGGYNDYYAPRYRNRGHYDWHDTSHYDYVPGQVYRHGNHYHYQPGHYQFHRDGHWDYHRGGHHGHWGH